MVSAGVPLPVVNPVAETVAVQPAPNPRLSVTWTTPRLALMVPPEAAEPRSALAGAVVPLSTAYAVSEAVGWLGGLDSLVTVVGGYSLFTPWTPLADVSDDQWSLA